MENKAVGGGVLVPIMWVSRRIHRIVSSTFAEETLACMDAIDEAIDTGNMLKEFLNLPRRPQINVYTDCRSLFDTVVTTKEPKEKRLKMDIAAIREMVETDVISNFM